MGNPISKIHCAIDGIDHPTVFRICYAAGIFFSKKFNLRVSRSQLPLNYFLAAPVEFQLDVMRAVGWSYTRLLRVPYLITAVLVVINLAIVGYLQPLALYDYQQLNYQLRSGAETP